MNYNNLKTLSKILNEKYHSHYDQYKSFVERHNLVRRICESDDLWIISQTIKEDEIYIQLNTHSWGSTRVVEYECLILPKKLAEKTLALYSFIEKENKTSLP
jgi:hypothetical protein